MGKLIIIGAGGMGFHTAVASLLAKRDTDVHTVPVSKDLDDAITKSTEEFEPDIISVEMNGKSPYQELVEEGIMPSLETPIHKIMRIVNEMTLHSHTIDDLPIVKKQKAKVIPLNVNCRKVKTKKPFNRKQTRSFAKRK